MKQKNKTIIVLFIIILIISSTIFIAKVFANEISNGEIIWNNGAMEEFSTVVPLSGGEYIAVGGSYTGAKMDLKQGGDAAIVKYNANNEPMWSPVAKIWGQDGFSEYFFDGLLDKNGNLIVIGYTNASTFEVGEKGDFQTVSNINKNEKPVLISYNTDNGEINWIKHYEGNSNLISTGKFYSILELDNGYVVAGTFAEDGPGTSSSGYKGIIIKYKYDGTIEWKQYVGGDKYNQIKSIIKVGENYIVAGTTKSNIGTNTLKGGEDVFVAKISNTGAVLWENSYGGNGLDHLHKIRQMDNGDILAVGYTKSTDLGQPLQGKTAGLIVKVNPDTGEITLGKIIGGDGAEHFTDVYDTDVGYILGGRTSSSKYNSELNNEFVYRTWLLKTDKEFNEKKYETIGVTSNGEQGIDTIFEMNNGIYASGVKHTGTSFDAVIVKIEDVITKEVTGNGTVDVVKTAKPGDIVKISTVPDEGYEVEFITVVNDWTNTEIQLSVNNEFTMPEADVVVKVAFKIKTYTIHSEVTGNGTITPSEDIIAEHGDSKTFTITPNSEYKAKKIEINGVDSTDLLVGDKLTISNIKEDKNIIVTFVKIEYRITLSKNVYGNAGDKTKEYSFTVTGIKDGKETVETYKLKADESITIDGFDYKTDFTVQEEEYTDYVVGITTTLLDKASPLTINEEERKVTGKFSTEGTFNINYSNTKNVAPFTGISNNKDLIIGISIVMLILIAYIIYSYKKKI